MHGSPSDFIVFSTGGCKCSHGIERETVRGGRRARARRRLRQAGGWRAGRARAAGRWGSRAERGLRELAGCARSPLWPSRHGRRRPHAARVHAAIVRAKPGHASPLADHSSGAAPRGRRSMPSCAHAPPPLPPRHPRALRTRTNDADEARGAWGCYLILKNYNKL